MNTVRTIFTYTFLVPFPIPGYIPTRDTLLRAPPHTPDFGCQLHIHARYVCPFVVTIPADLYTCLPRPFSLFACTGDICYPLPTLYTHAHTHLSAVFAPTLHTTRLRTTPPTYICYVVVRLLGFPHCLTARRLLHHAPVHAFYLLRLACTHAPTYHHVTPLTFFSTHTWVGGVG